MARFLTQHRVAGTGPAEYVAERLLDGEIGVADRAQVWLRFYAQVLSTEPAHSDVVRRVRQHMREPEVASKTSHDGTLAPLDPMRLSPGIIRRGGSAANRLNRAGPPTRCPRGCEAAGAASPAAWPRAGRRAQQPSRPARSLPRDECSPAGTPRSRRRTRRKLTQPGRPPHDRGRSCASREYR